MKKLLGYIRFVNIEAIFWLGGLIYLASADTGVEGHFSLCPLSALGFDFCPGCGIGRSLTYLLHGDLNASVNAHYLGIFALIVITLRLIALTKNCIEKYKLNSKMTGKENGYGI